MSCPLYVQPSGIAEIDQPMSIDLVCVAHTDMFEM